MPKGHSHQSPNCCWNPYESPSTPMKFPCSIPTENLPINHHSKPKFWMNPQILRRTPGGIRRASSWRRRISWNNLRRRRRCVFFFGGFLTREIPCMDVDLAFWLGGFHSAGGSSKWIVYGCSPMETLWNLHMCCFLSYCSVNWCKWEVRSTTNGNKDQLYSHMGSYFAWFHIV